MKASAFFLLISVTLCLFLASSGRGANWEYYGERKDGSRFYYDSESITTGTNDTLIVWTKEIYSDSGRTTEVSNRAKDGRSTEGYENLSHDKVLWEFNCETRKLRMIQYADYDLNGRILEGQSATGKDYQVSWGSIVPESMGEALFKKVCKTRTKK